MKLARIKVEFKKSNFLRSVPARSLIYIHVYILSLASGLFINFFATLTIKGALASIG